MCIPVVLNKTKTLRPRPHFWLPDWQKPKLWPRHLYSFETGGSPRTSEELNGHKGRALKLRVHQGR